ncbi:MAG: SHOCT domain-containing protein [Oscillospiraceae bacterium]|nr:SHOCT domain-containing protein [Oscillospiraceae bacterium]
MDNQASVYSEKSLAHFESSYRENMLSKPQDVNITITAMHIYGVAYIWEQKGTKEEGPNYMRFTCGLEEITKIEINRGNRNSPIYIQCDDTTKSVITRKRIILPNFSNSAEIVEVLTEAKKELEAKLEVQRANEKNQKLKDLESRKKAADDEFESMTSGYKDFKKSLEKPPVPEVKEEPAPKAEVKPEPAPAPEPKPAPKPAPAPAPAPEPKPKPAPAPAPAPEPKPAPKPAPAPALAPEPKPEPKPAPEPEPKPKKSDPASALKLAPAKALPTKPAPAPEPKPAAESEPAPAIEGIDTKGSITVDDILSLDEFLGIHAEETPADMFMESIESEPDEESLDSSLPEEILQKKPADIEELAVPQMPEDKDEPAPAKPAKKQFEGSIEELNTNVEIAKKLSAKNEPKPAPKKEEPKPEPKAESKPEEEKVSEPPIVNNDIDKDGKDVSLDDFETAVKKLKTMLDNGVITESEFAQEKRKLLNLLY